MSRRRYFQPVLRAVSQAFGLFIGGFDNRKRGREKIQFYTSFIRFLPILRSDTTKIFIMSNTDRPNSILKTFGLKS